MTGSMRRSFWLLVFFRDVNNRSVVAISICETPQSVSQSVSQSTSQPFLLWEVLCETLLALSTDYGAVRVYGFDRSQTETPRTLVDAGPRTAAPAVPAFQSVEQPPRWCRGPCISSLWLGRFNNIIIINLFKPRALFIKFIIKPIPTINYKLFLFPEKYLILSIRII